MAAEFEKLNKKHVLVPRWLEGYDDCLVIRKKVNKIFVKKEIQLNFYFKFRVEYVNV